VAGHDRGARVAYRLALDVPQAVRKLCVMDIIPTADVCRAGSAGGVSMYHCFLLAQPCPLPGTLIANSGDFFIRWILDRWSGPGFHFPPESLADYLATFRDADVLHATCEDYRAGWHVDRLIDEEDVGRRIEAPTLLLWGRDGTVDKTNPLSVWANSASDIRGWSVPGGHFVPEEAAVETAEALKEFFLK
jgi:haloacetate dehalogenase